MNAPVLFAGFFPIFAFLPACERNARISETAGVSSPSTGNEIPVDPAERFRSALNEGKLEQARSAVESVPDAEYRGFLRDQLNRAVEQQIRQRANDNPEQTMDAILKGEEQLEIFWLEVAMSEFLINDREGALAWQAAHAGILDVEVNDRILLAIARNALAAGDWRSAQAVKDEVGQPELMQAIADGIGAAMEQDIRALVRDSAGDAMKTLLQGDSGFETFWIEVAMNEYLAVDPRGAEKWYWAHGRSLTPDQHDRVALAYARAANQSGDDSLATQWANQLKDPELRDVVHGEIVD